MTLAQAISIALRAYDEDEAEREAILDALAPILLGTRGLFRYAIERAWLSSDEGDHANEIREAIADYQERREAIDAEAAAADTCRLCARRLDVDGNCMDCRL